MLERYRANWNTPEPKEAPSRQRLANVRIIVRPNIATCPTPCSSDRSKYQYRRPLTVTGVKRPSDELQLD